MLFCQDEKEFKKLEEAIQAGDPLLTITMNSLGLTPGSIPIKWYSGSGGDNWRNEQGELLSGTTKQRGDLESIV